MQRPQRCAGYLSKELIKKAALTEKYVILGLLEGDFCFGAAALHRYIYDLDIEEFHTDPACREYGYDKVLFEWILGLACGVGYHRVTCSCVGTREEILYMDSMMAELGFSSEDTTARTVQASCQDIRQSTLFSQFQNVPCRYVAKGKDVPKIVRNTFFAEMKVLADQEAAEYIFDIAAGKIQGAVSISFRDDILRGRFLNRSMGDIKRICQLYVSAFTQLLGDRNGLVSFLCEKQEVERYHMMGFSEVETKGMSRNYTRELRLAELPGI